MSERRFGILIASSRFPEEPKLEDLRCPEGDVDGFNEILASKDHGEFTETLVLKNKPHHEVLRNINRVLREASKNDLVLIYYSGHGKLNPAGRLHLATVDTVFQELEATSIPVETIRSYVDISKSNKVVLILDCCYSGAAGDEFAKTRSDVGDQLQLISGGRGTYIMTASTGLQVAQEKESDKHGVFTKHILEGIREGEADLDSDGHITMEELYRYVHDKVLDEGFQEPMKWDLNVRGELVIARSGKIPGEERRKQIRELMFDLAKAGTIPKDILDKGLEVIALDPTELSGELRAYDDLLEQLLQTRVEPGEFIRKWDQIGWKPSPQKVEPAAPEVPPPEPIKPERRPREPKIPEPRKMSRTLKFGALAGVAVLLLIVGWWYISQQEARRIRLEIRHLINRIDEQVYEMEQDVGRVESLGQLEELQRPIDAIIRELAALDQKAGEVGMSPGLGHLKRRTDNLRQLLATKKQRLTEAERPKEPEPPREVVKAGRLFVETMPRGARVRILNIGPKFHQGIELEPGDYHLEVSADGYETETRWIGLLAGEGKTISFELIKIETQPQETVTNSIGMKFVLIPAGSFMMGSGLSPEEIAQKYGGDAWWYKREHPQHPVKISKPFYLQTTEVTQGQWEKVMGKNPSVFEDCGDDCPVDNVSWNSVQDFIKKLNKMENTGKYRLPTEAEWEYACRAGTTTPFHTGNCISTDQANYNGLYAGMDCLKGKHRKRTVNVGSFRANAWGLYDMHGNVVEWCQDYYGDYPKGMVKDPQGPSTGKQRVARSGSCDAHAMDTRSANRDAFEPATAYVISIGIDQDSRIPERKFHLGFRVARDF